MNQCLGRTPTYSHITDWGLIFFQKKYWKYQKQAENRSVMKNGAISLDIPTYPEQIWPSYGKRMWVLPPTHFPEDGFGVHFLWVGNRMTPDFNHPASKWRTSLKTGSFPNTPKKDQKSIQQDGALIPVISAVINGPQYMAL